MLDYLSPEEFNAFARSHEQSTFFQSSMWGDLKKNNGWIPYIVGIKEGYDIKGATLLLAKKIPVFNKYIFYAPRGFLINYKSDTFLDNFTRQVVNFVKKKHGIFLKINPYVEYQERDTDGNIVPNGFKNDLIIQKLTKLGFKHNGFTINYGIDLEPRWLSVLNIKHKTANEILQNMRGTTRWSINNSYKHGLKLVECDRSRIKDFKQLMEHTSERRGFIDRPLSYYEEMYDAFGKDIKVLLVELNLEENLNALKEKYNKAKANLDKELAKEKKKDNVIAEYKSQMEANLKKIAENEEQIKKYGSNIVVAGGLFMLFGKQVISLFGASYKEFMKYDGQYFLNYEMIKYAIDNNYDYFNFFGITGEFDENNEMYGLFNFKRGFGAKVVELIGEFNIVTNKLFYPIYKLMYYVYKKNKR